MDFNIVHNRKKLEAVNQAKDISKQKAFAVLVRFYGLMSMINH